MAALGRWAGVDPLADMYSEWSPYNYVADNPGILVDLNGDSINVAQMRLWDQLHNTNHLNTLVSQLEQITGLSLSVTATDQLTYQMDNNGNPVIATDKSGKQIVSQTARNILVAGISASDVVRVSTVQHMGSAADGANNLIGLNPTQIQHFVNGAQGGLNPMTMDIGMTFLHEFQHTKVGGGLSDGKPSFGVTGPVAARMNKVRSELGPSYGQRLSYQALKLSNSGPAYLPFDTSSLKRLSAGLPPKPGTKFIKF